MIDDLARRARDGVGPVGVGKDDGAVGGYLRDVGLRAEVARQLGLEGIHCAFSLADGRFYRVSGGQGIPLSGGDPEAAALDLNAEDAVTGDEDEEIDFPGAAGGNAGVGRVVAGGMDDDPAVGGGVVAEQAEHPPFRGRRAGGDGFGYHCGHRENLSCRVGENPCYAPLVSVS